MKGGQIDPPPHQEKLPSKSPALLGIKFLALRTLGAGAARNRAMEIKKS